MKAESRKFDTQYIDVPNELQEDRPSPCVFVCCGSSITEYPLADEQLIGRPDDGLIPDIPIADPFVSRRHGQFRTTESGIEYAADETKNGVFLNGIRVQPGETVLLCDGDELSIPSYAGGNRTDITLELAFSNARIDFWRGLRDSSRDKLTGLGDRKSFERWWAKSYSHRDYLRAGVFILDIDDFKQINDGYGHAVGDKVIQFLAMKLKDFVRDEEQLCRWGGDEFTGVISGDIGYVQTRLCQMSEEIANSHIEDGISFTISIGVVDITQEEERADLERLVRLADKALYEAKIKGKNGVIIYSRSAC